MSGCFMVLLLLPLVSIYLTALIPWHRLVFLSRSLHLLISELNTVFCQAWSNISGDSRRAWAPQDGGGGPCRMRGWALQDEGVGPAGWRGWALQDEGVGTAGWSGWAPQDEGWALGHFLSNLDP